MNWEVSNRSDIADKLGVSVEELKILNDVTVSSMLSLEDF